MAKAGKPVPEGFHMITLQLTVDGAAKAIEFYRKAFGAEEMYRAPGPDGKIMNAQLRFGDTMMMLNDEMQMGPGPAYSRAPTNLKGTTACIQLYVPDCDALWKRAVDAGAKPVMPLMDAFWGDRYGQVVDPFGHVWAIATRKLDMTPEEMKKAGDEFMTSVAKQLPKK